MKLTLFNHAHDAPNQWNLVIHRVQKEKFSWMFMLLSSIEWKHISPVLVLSLKLLYIYIYIGWNKSEMK